jgi:hypothetical protein
LHGALWISRGLPPNLSRKLILAKADVNRVPQEVVSRPSQIGDLRDKLRLDPMHAGKNERRAEAGLARRQDGQRRFGTGQRLKAAPQIGEDLVSHPSANPPARPLDSIRAQRSVLLAARWIGEERKPAQPTDSRLFP